jgi:hypothetical protein
MRLKVHIRESKQSRGIRGNKGGRRRRRRKRKRRRGKERENEEKKPVLCMAAPLSLFLVVGKRRSKY